MKTGPFRIKLGGRRELPEVELSAEEEQIADFLNSASEDQIADIFSEEELAETEGMSEEEVSHWFLGKLWNKIKKSGTKAGKWVRKFGTKAGNFIKKWGKKKEVQDALFEELQENSEDEEKVAFWSRRHGRRRDRRRGSLFR